MAAQLTSKKLTIKDTTVAIIIPNNPKAELMYYLDCVATVLMTDKLQRYRNYGEYYYLPDSEIDNLLEIARIFNPKAMVEAGIFIADEDINGMNRFYEITNEEMGLHVNEEIFIGGVRVQVLKLMVFKQSWVIRYYIEPYASLTRRNQHVLTNTFNTNNVYSRRQDSMEECDDCFCDCNIF